jgi:hypothetical protein
MRKQLFHFKRDKVDLKKKKERKISLSLIAVSKKSSWMGKCHDWYFKKIEIAQKKILFVLQRRTIL